jgi:mRNA interferase MazF
VFRGTGESRQMGLHSNSVIVTDNLATVLDAEIDRIIGKCANMRPIDDALRHTLAR